MGLNRRDAPSALTAIVASHTGGRLWSRPASSQTPFETCLLVPSVAALRVPYFQVGQRSDADRWSGYPSKKKRRAPLLERAAGLLHLEKDSGPLAQTTTANHTAHG